MAENKFNLRDKAKSLYENSGLKDQDTRFNKEERKLIKEFLSQIGIHVTVDSNPFEIDGIRFTSSYFRSSATDSSEIIASHSCSLCKGRYELRVDYHSDDYYERFSLAEFGKWVSSFKCS